MPDYTKNILVTGANSGLGLGICLRMIDDFLNTQPTSVHLNLIFTTRSKKKGTDTLATLNEHLEKRYSSPHTRVRIRFQSETNVELTSLLSVQDLARRLNASDLTHLDAIICNAGIGGWSGMNWPRVMLDILKDIRNNTTFPAFKLGIVGLVTKPQLPENVAHNMGPEPPLGEVFCANLFGHYMLAHWLMPLLRACNADSPGKIVWVSSIEPQGKHYNPDDLQGLRSNGAYEHSKRMTDILNLTSSHLACRPSVEEFYSLPTQSAIKNSSSTVSGPKRPDNGSPRMEEMHPGIVVTSVVTLYWIVNYGYLMGIYLARLLGAPWSTVFPYTAALAATWLALSPEKVIQQRTRDAQPSGTGKIKWGTAVSRSGTPMVQPSDVYGWGINGSGQPFADSWWGGKYLGATYGRGREPESRDATKEDVEKFINEGVDLWKQMEALRKDWQKRIEEYERGKGVEE